MNRSQHPRRLGDDIAHRRQILRAAHFEIFDIETGPRQFGSGVVGLTRDGVRGALESYGNGAEYPGELGCGTTLRSR